MSAADIPFHVVAQFFIVSALADVASIERLRRPRTLRAATVRRIGYPHNYDEV